MDFLRKIFTKIKRTPPFIALIMIFRGFNQNKKSQLAESYWKNKNFTNDKHGYGKIILDHVQIDISIKKINSVMEFGANFAQNLRWFKDAYPDIKLVGIDINEIVKNAESEWSNYSGIVGNQKNFKKLC
mgnify:CR=1 FL=1|jgi:hypothetical protein